MRLVAATSTLFVTVIAPVCAMEIGGMGGNVQSHRVGFYEAAKRGESARLNTTCRSACTTFLGIFPKERICVGPGARLGFHLGSTPDSRVSVGSTSAMWGSYPADVQAWINARGGLTKEWLWMGARDLWKLGYRRC